MRHFPIGSTIFTPFYSPADAGGSGGDTGGGNPDAGAGNTGAGGVSTPDPANDPLDIDENRLIRVKGSDKPIKFGEYGRNFQSQFTKASQRAAALEKELKVERDNRANYERERAASANRQPQGNNQAKPDLFAQLEALPYLSGKDATAVVRSITEQFEQRDQVLLATLKQLKQMQGIVKGLDGNYKSQTFESKIAKFVTDGDIPTELTQWAKELYMAYEGDDLDEQFPQILKERYEEVGKALENRKAAKLRDARKQPFIPGKGGNTGPSKLTQLKPNASSKDVADLLWNQGWEGAET